MNQEESADETIEHLPVPEGPPISIHPGLPVDIGDELHRGLPEQEVHAGVPEGPGEIHDEEPVEPADVRWTRPPIEPTDSERKSHELTHLPFRSWCRFCVAGRARADPHFVREPEYGGVPSFSADYFFIDNDAAESNLTCIAVRERYTKMAFAHVAPGKQSTDEFLAKCIVDDIDSLGMSDKQIVFKTDQEAAIKSLVTNIKKRLPHVIAENSPVYDKQAAGHGERAVQSVEHQSRVLLLALESRLHARLPGDHSVLHWLTPHAAWLISRFELGKHGRTPYQRLKGKPCRGHVFEFGEQVMAKHPLPSRGVR